MNKKVFLLCALLLTAARPTYTGSDLPIYGLMADKAKKLNLFKNYPRIPILLGAASVILLNYELSTRHCSKNIWRTIKSNGLWSKKNLNIAYSTTMLAAMGLLAAKTAVEMYDGVEIK